MLFCCFCGPVWFLMSVFSSHSESRFGFWFANLDSVKFNNSVLRRSGPHKCRNPSCNLCLCLFSELGVTPAPAAPKRIIRVHLKFMNLHYQTHTCGDSHSWFMILISAASLFHVSSPLVFLLSASFFFSSFCLFLTVGLWAGFCWCCFLVSHASFLFLLWNKILANNGVFHKMKLVSEWK